ncbi:MAG TPA: hypothetical protein VNK24_04010 [Elusimicrobiota bacterium]|nr:hypothetical protein [Elusimicrobiota bacterium]
MRSKKLAAVQGSLFAVLLLCGWGWSAEIGGEGGAPIGAENATPIESVENLSVAAPLGTLPGSQDLFLSQEALGLGRDASLPRLPSATAPAAMPSESAPAAFIGESAAVPGETPMAPSIEPSARTLAAASEKNHPNISAQTQALQIAAGVSAAQGSGSQSPASGAALETGFDGAAVQAMDPVVAEDLRTSYPRVVFIEDGFAGPVSEKTVASIEKLLDAGVHVVFMTQRRLKGPDSAETILVSRLRNRQTNPLIIASYGGAKISVASRAENPKSLIEDQPGFNEKAVSLIQSVTEKINKTLSKGASLRGEFLPAADHPLAYALEIPAEVSEAKVAEIKKNVLSRYNRALAAAGLPYRLRASAGDSRQMTVSAMPLSSSLPRIYRALGERFAEESLMDKSDKFLVLAAQSKLGMAARFPAAADVQVVKSAGDLDALLGAVLKDNQLPGVSVKLGKLRQYVEYWEPKHRMRTPDDGDGFSGGVSGGSRSSGSGAVDKDFARYTGGIINQLMAFLYEQINRGNHAMTNLSAVEAKLRQMWYLPLKHGVFVDQGLLKVMHTKAWKSRQRGYLEYANSYLINFYLRELYEYSVAAADIRAHLLRLKTDWNSGVAVDFRSAATGREYKIHTRIPRTMWRDTAQGRVLEAYAYRTGKESFGDGEELYAQILAMALLKGDARMGPDGKWHMGAPDGPAISKLKVQIEYRSGHRTWTFDPEEFLQGREQGGIAQGPIAQRITSAIERMEADPEYEAYYSEQEQGISKSDWDKKKATTRRAQKAAKSRKANAAARAAAKAK